MSSAEEKKEISLVEEESTSVVRLSYASKEGKASQRSGQKRKSFSKYYYKVSDHSELNKVGVSFYNDYQKGIKNFAIASTGYPLSQQKTILGLASFFDHREDLKILIVGSKLDTGLFKNFLENCHDETLDLMQVTGKKINLKRFHFHFDFLEVQDFFELCDEDQPTYEYEEMVKSVLDRYDVVFWDLPNLEEIKKRSHYYYPLTAQFELLTVVVGAHETSKVEVEKLRSFYQKYNVQIKGFLIQNSLHVGPKGLWGKFCNFLKGGGE